MKLRRPGIFSLLFPCIFFMIFSCSNEEEQGMPTVRLLPRNDKEGSNPDKILDVRVRLNHPTDLPVTITYSTKDSTARSFRDFIPIADTTMVFNPGETEKIINIELISDKVTEFTEGFGLRISNVENALGAFQYLPITIYDDDFNNVYSGEDGFVSQDTIEGMDLVFADEFNAAELNRYIWVYNDPDGTWANQIQQYTFSPDNLKVEEGKLKITAIKDGDNYTSAGINTISRLPIQYGLLQVRAKMPEGAGLWPSIWLLGKSYNGRNWPLCGEIDLAMMYGQRPGQTTGSVDYYLSGDVRREGHYDLPDYKDKFADEYHVFSILWQPDQIEWFVDNHPYTKFNKSTIGDVWPFNNPFWIVISLAVGGNLVGNPDFSTQFPQTLEVDYIRLYRPH
jgi:beta-glucanase (GH16 family)